jgi:protein Mpv17
MSRFAPLRARLTRLAIEHPRKFGGTAAATMGTCGDQCAQRIEQRGCRERGEVAQPINIRRTFAMASFCATCATCVYVPFFAWLDRFFGSGTSLKTVLQKTAANQLVVSPFFDVPFYLSWSSFVAGMSAEETIGKIRCHYVDTVLGTWAVWVPMCLGNFAYVPLHFRVTVAYTAEFVWTCLISWLSHRPTKTLPAEASAATEEPAKSALPSLVEHVVEPVVAEQRKLTRTYSN